MASITRTEQLALLLNLLGEEAKQAALSSLDGITAKNLQEAFKDFETHPPTQDEVEYVVDDFQKYFQLALQSVEDTSAAPLEGEQPEEQIEETEEPFIFSMKEEDFDVNLEIPKKFQSPKLTGNVTLDLNRMHPYQVAQAIKNETSSTISVVIRNLATEHAAKTLELLPEEIRPIVFLNLGSPSKILPIVEAQILKMTLDLARRVETREPVEDSSRQMVQLMRSMPKTIRTSMLEELMNTNEDLGNKVKDGLYQFDDLMRLSDSDIQTVLGKSSTDSLVLALQGADEELIRKILNNMSKRARETLLEEMEFKTNAKSEEIEFGRAAIVTTISSLDEAGTISLD